MTTKYVKGDALEWASKAGYCMIHVCNAQGKMGSGIAKQVKERFPEAYKRYISLYKDYSVDKFLGWVCTEPTFSVINMVAQEFYGYEGKQYISYGHLKKCLTRILNASENLRAHQGIHTIVVPYKMGADRAGGDWEVIIKMVEDVLGEYFEILVVEWEKKL